MAGPSPAIDAAMSSQPVSRILSTMRITPSAARRSAYGSFDPVGFSSIAQKPTSVSSLSASATAIDDRLGRHAIVGPLRLVVILDRRGDGRVFALRAARSSGPSSPAARGTRRPFR